ncbi:MAG: hypothetical protein IPK63_23435 [Candidatus Competibacteraceae bacterium]|nr:hypothetical protein [Candidatus Competibacteraceae bacterium]
MPSVVRVEQPAATARALATELGAAGIAVQPTLQGKSWFIDVPVLKPHHPK